MKIKIMRPRSDFEFGEEGYRQFRSQEIKFVEIDDSKTDMMEQAKQEQIEEFMNGGSHKFRSVSQIKSDKTIRRI